MYLVDTYTESNVCVIVRTSPYVRKDGSMKVGDRTNVTAPPGKAVIVYEDPRDPGPYNLTANRVCDSVEEAALRCAARMEPERVSLGVVNDKGCVAHIERC